MFSKQASSVKHQVLTAPEYLLHCTEGSKTIVEGEAPASEETPDSDIKTNIKILGRGCGCLPPRC